MIVYPAIDLLGGSCVRLTQGRFEQATRYDISPERALARFAGSGASWMHIVDLDGARAGVPVQHALVAELAHGSPVKLQVAGGFRTREHVAHMLDCGSARVVIGSLAVERPSLVRDLLAEFGSEPIALALDVHMIGEKPIVAFGGWTKTSNRSLFDLIEEFPDARHVLVTDIARDGTRSGPNVELIKSIIQALPRLKVQASGGVATLDDLHALADAGAAGAIVGKALWEGDIDLKNAVERARA